MIGQAAPPRRLDGALIFGMIVVVASAVIYWLAARPFDAARGDFFYLADAFLHGRTWLDFSPGPQDVIIIGDRVYVPFAPFPAIAMMPLVALIGPVTADHLGPAINAFLAASGVGLCWWMLGRIGVPRRGDRLWLTLLFGFSTQILWVTTRGGVWHTGQLVATILTFACLVELWGKQRAWLIGLMAGAAFLTRAPLAFAIPFYALMLDADSVRRSAAAVGDSTLGRERSIPWRRWTWLALGVLPSIVFFFLYNQLRFGSPFESGYALATLAPFLADLRAQGLFSLSHVTMNLDYLFFHLPVVIATPPFLQPDGFGLSIFLTSPGLLYAVRADWRLPRTWALLGAAVATLIPSLLYYGGGWLQYGYRYFLDSIPFVIALCGLAAVRRRRMGPGWMILIVFGMAVMALGVYWAYRI